MYHLDKIKPDEIHKIVSIHISAFPNFFLTNLGSDVLFQFYTYLLKDKDTFSYNVKKDNNILGFAVANTNVKGLYKRIFICGFFDFLSPLIISFIKKPSLLKKMIISFISTQKRNNSNNILASLLSICVNPHFAGNGLGNMLISSIESDFRKSNVKSYFLTTDSDNNELTNRFYLKNDFLLQSTVLQGERRMNLFVKLLK